MTVTLTAECAPRPPENRPPGGGTSNPPRALPALPPPARPVRVRVVALVAARVGGLVVSDRLVALVVCVWVCVWVRAWVRVCRRVRVEDVDVAVALGTAPWTIGGGVNAGRGPGVVWGAGGIVDG
ncbi:hypothetical protein ABN028_07480 [Actinopolymorpha sp. B17G11]|uniref:hypothetical protein n=1 Tax=unclassified Actinopolymorpha TaxID=2627063 RepID=UPI0032D957BF